MARGKWCDPGQHLTLISSGRLFRGKCRVRPIGDVMQMENSDIDATSLIGTTIIDALQVYRSRGVEGDLDWSSTYFMLSDGRTITLPMSFSPWIHAEAIPDDAQHLNRKFQNSIFGSEIVEVYNVLDSDGDLSDHCVFIEIRNGCFITEVNTAPHGTGEANLWVWGRAEFDRFRTNPRRS